MASRRSRRPSLSLQARSLDRLPAALRRRLRRSHPELTAEADLELAPVRISRAYARARRRRAYVMRTHDSVGVMDTGRAAETVCYSAEPKTKRTLVACIMNHLFGPLHASTSMNWVLSFVSGTHTGRVVGSDGAGGAAPDTPLSDAIGEYEMSAEDTRRFFMSLPRPLLALAWESWAVENV
jgi:hypothetical protein